MAVDAHRGVEVLPPQEEPEQNLPPQEESELESEISPEEVERMRLKEERRKNNEEQWLISGSPNDMLMSLTREFGEDYRVNDRKTRLFFIECLKSVSNLSNQNIIDVAEKYIDGVATPEEIESCANFLHEMDNNDLYHNSAHFQILFDDSENIDHHPAALNGYSVDIATILSRDIDTQSHYLAEFGGEQKYHAVLLRDIIGNPFKETKLDPEWKTSTVVSLAKSFYESKDFSPMPILSDALQDAGCENEEILNHCRQNECPHVRGCWVIDLILGKQ